MDTIELKDPVEFGSEKVQKLEFRTPKMGDIKQLKLSDPSISDIMGLASRLSGVSIQVMDRLSIEDGMKVAELMGNYLNPSQKTGAT